MRVSNSLKPVAAATCAAALVVSGAGFASAQGQGSLGDAGSSAVPVFDSPSTAGIVALGEGAYTATYTNRSAEDLACFGVVLPGDVAEGFYEEMKTTDFTIVDDPDEEPEPSESQEALNAAMSDGHFAVMLGEGGIGVRDYLRLVYVAQFEADEIEYTEEELEELLDQMMEAGGFLYDLFDGQDFINFVDQGDTATWSAVMPEPLPEGEAAGGIVACFNGLDSDLVLAETTYVEIEHARESTGDGGNGDEGTLPSGIFGSIERIFSSAS